MVFEEEGVELIEEDEELEWENETEEPTLDKKPKYKRKFYLKLEKCPYCQEIKMQTLSVRSEQFKKTIDYFCHSCGRLAQKIITYDQNFNVLDEIMVVKYKK